MPAQGGRDARAGVLLLLRTLVVLPQLIPLVAFILLPGVGLLDYGLAKLGWGSTTWLGDPSLALGAIIAITIWKNTGYDMLFFLAGLAATVAVRKAMADQVQAVLSGRAKPADELLRPYAERTALDIPK